MLHKVIIICIATVIPAIANAGADDPASDGSLKQVMQRLDQDYSSLNHAILVKNFDAAERSAHAIAYHEKPSLGQRMKILRKLGSEMSAFKNADEKVHRLAIKVEEAAKAKDMSLLIRYQSQMLSTCMGCHTSYRNEIVNSLDN